MKMKKAVKLASLALAATTFAGTLAACGGGSSGAVSGVLTINYYDGSYGNVWLEEAAKEFCKTKEGVTYELIPDVNNTQTAATQMKSGKNLSDIYMLNYGTWVEWVAYGYLEDLSSVYDAEVETSTGKRTIKEYMADDYENGYYMQRRYGQGESKPWAMPWAMANIGLVYNENILLATKHTTAKAGAWEVGDTWTAPPETVEDLLAYCADLNANKDENGKAAPITPFVFPAKASHWFKYLIQVWWAQYQGVYEENTLNVQEGDGTFYDFWNYETLDVYKQAGIVKGIETVESVFINKATAEGEKGSWKNSVANVDSYDVKDAERQFVKGEAAMLIGASFMYNDVVDYMSDGMVFKMMHMPTIENAAKNADGTTQKINYFTKEDFWIVPAKAPNKELAKEFMTFLCSERWLVEFTRRAGSFRPFEYADAVKNDTEFTYNEFAKSVLKIYDESDVKLVTSPANIDPNERTLMSLYKIGSLNVSGRMVWATFMQNMKSNMTASALMEKVLKDSTKDYNTWKRDLEG